jgi:heme A synthase
VGPDAPRHRRARAGHRGGASARGAVHAAIEEVLRDRDLPVWKAIIFAGVITETFLSDDRVAEPAGSALLQSIQTYTAETRQALLREDFAIGDQALVQFNHRIWAYVLLIGGTGYAVQAWRWRLAEGLGAAAFAVAGALWLQALLGIATLMSATPLWLGALHQAGAALVLAMATLNLWLVRRSQGRLFTSGPRSRGL